MRDVLFVTGCQRSGTTILTEALMRSPEVYDYRDRIDSELHGALILSGLMKFERHDKRLCFQTTYLNERYKEYFVYENKYKMIYLLRNPWSVVYSMCYNWRPRFKLRNFALNELFYYCGSDLLDKNEKKLFKTFGTIAFSSMRKACLSYVAKTKQLFEIKSNLNDNCMVMDYDDLVSKVQILLPQVYSFFNLEYDENYLSILHKNSSGKRNLLTSQQTEFISNMCQEIYENGKALIDLKC